MIFGNTQIFLKPFPRIQANVQIQANVFWRNFTRAPSMRDGFFNGFSEAILAEKTG